MREMRRCTCRASWLVIDEVSMIEVALWDYLQRLKFMGVRYILLGDFEQQGPGFHDDLRIKYMGGRTPGRDQEWCDS